MKFKIWPLLALVLFGLSLVIRKVHIAKSDYTNAQKVEKSTTPIPGFDAEMVYLTDPVPQSTDQPIAQSAERSPGSTSLQFGAGGNLKGIPLARSQLSEGDDLSDVPVEDKGQSGGALAFLLANLVTIVWALIALIEVIVRLTPTEKDNSILSFLTDILSKIIPNRRAGGGTL